MSKKNNLSYWPVGLLALAALVIFKKKRTLSTVTGIGRINVKYFDVNASTGIDDLKKQYYNLAKKHHPDTGGTNEAFREMNDEYEYLQKLILSNGNFTTSEQSNETEISEIYRDIINSLIILPGIIIELVGSWIWISGNTYPVKEQIKEAGFKFHGKKSMWFWHPGEYRKFNNSEMDMDDIRQRYGSKQFESKTASNRLNGINSLSAKLLKLQKLLVKREQLNNDPS
jgi:hypothetical protein